MRLVACLAMLAVLALAAGPASAVPPPKDPTLPGPSGGPGVPIGPGPGMGGGNSFHLIMQKSVQEDLKVTDDQLKKLNELQTKLADLQKEAAKDPKKIAELIKLQAENEKAVADILKKEQATRLSQIALQQKGSAALLEPATQTALKFTREQQDQSIEVLKEMSKALQELVKPGIDPKELGKKLESIQKESGEKLLKLMSVEQKKQWAEMTGEPFKGKIEPPPGIAFPPFPPGPGPKPGDLPPPPPIKPGELPPPPKPSLPPIP